MNAEIFAALKQLERERGIPTDYMVDKITQALTAAYKKNCEGYKENIHVVLGEEGIRMYALVEGAVEILAYLRPKYKLYIASNGVAATQDSRFRDAGLTGWFDDIFISERIGHHKPEKAYFDACFAQIPGFRRDRAIIVGDSLSSDILGGINAGIATCWFNYRRRPARDDIRPDYTIDTLEELKSIL